MVIRLQRIWFELWISVSCLLNPQEFFSGKSKSIWGAAFCRCDLFYQPCCRLCIAGLFKQCSTQVNCNVGWWENTLVIFQHIDGYDLNFRISLAFGVWSQSLSLRISKDILGPFCLFLSVVVFVCLGWMSTSPTSYVPEDPANRITNSP